MREGNNNKGLVNKGTFMHLVELSEVFIGALPKK
jgi:hypothetical protein